MCKHLFHSRFRWAINGLLLVGVLAVLGWLWVPLDLSSPQCDLARNGAWISVDWTSQPVNEAAVAELARNASARQLAYLFPYLSYIKPDGTFSQSYAHAPEFVAAFRRFNQDTRLLAWVGIPLKNDAIVGLRGWVELADPITRRKIVEFVLAQVNEASLDGVHLNVEPVFDDDRNYLLLLEEVRAALGPGRTISIAASQWKPDVLEWLPLLGNLKWSGKYYRSVAQRVDQIATMTYDSYQPHPALYRVWLREQVRGISKSLAGAGVELLFGISISREQTPSHWVGAEDLPNGLAGTCAGQVGLSQSERIAQGVAIYAAWEAEASDWQIWDEWRR